jgi:hypothetical protein
MARFSSRVKSRLSHTCIYPCHSSISALTRPDNANFASRVRTRQWRSSRW